VRKAIAPIAEVRTRIGLATVCAVGEGLAADHALVADALDALRDLPVHLVARPSGQRTLAFVIDATHTTAAMTRLHDRFFGARRRHSPAPRPTVQT
jgi:aspartokinase